MESRPFQIWVELLKEIYYKIMKRLQTMIIETGFKSLKELRSWTYDLDLAYQNFKRN